MKLALRSIRAISATRAILPFAVLAVASSSPAFTFTDPTMGSFFYQKNYLTYGTESSSTVYSGANLGNPGNGMSIRHNINPNELTGASALALGSAYTITGSGIANLSFGIDYLAQSLAQGGNPSFGFALEQNGKRYVALLNATPFNGGYSQSSASGLVATDFHEIDILSGSVVDSMSHPNFQLTGASMKFGIFSYADATFPDTVETYFDNFTVTVTEAVPEPSSFLAAGIGIVGLLRRKGQKKS